SKVLEQYLRRTRARLVIGQKLFVAHLPVGANQVVTRKWYAVEGMSRRDIGIQDSVVADDHAALVGQHWVIDVICIAEFLERSERVVRDRRHLDAVLCECGL